MSTAALDITSVRARFSALDRRLAFFDGPGGTQCPDDVIDAISRYLRESNANIGAPYETSHRTDELVELAHERAASFLGCSAGEVAFGQSMTALNFLLTRAFARTLREGDEIVVTALDHDANVAPWLELAHDRGIVVRIAGLTDDLELDYGDLERQLSERTRVVAFPVAANSVGTAPDVRRVVELAHSADALAWADAVHYAPHGPIDVAAWDVDVLICSPYKFFGPHMGLAYGKRQLLESWRPYKVRPAANEPVGHRFELGTSQHELLAGFVAAVDYVDSLGWDAMLAHERALGERFLDGLPETIELYGIRGMERTRPDLLLQRSRTQPGRGRDIPGRPRRRRLAWRLLRDRDDEVPRARRRRRTRGHRPLQHRGRGRPPARRARRAGVKLLLLGGPLFLGRAVTEAALARGHELTFFNRGRTNSELYPEVERLIGDRAGDLGVLQGRDWDAVIDTCGYLPSVVRASAEALASSGLYCFVSSISVYADFSVPVDEDSPVAALGDLPEDEVTNENYGALKALCETGGRRRVRRPRARRPARAHHRAARPNRPLHVLAPPDCAEEARSSRPRRRPTRRSRSTFATSASGSSRCASAA